MTTQASSPSGETLQFDRAEPANPAHAADPAAARCGECGTSLRTEYFDVSGVATCPRCKDKLVADARPLRAWGPTMRAALFGFGAALAGAVLYYGIIAITDFEIGLVAIVTGYMVGWSVKRGAGGRGGRRLQLAAAGLTYLSVALAYTPLAVQGGMEGESAPADSVQAAPPATDRDQEARDADAPASVVVQGDADAAAAYDDDVRWVGPLGFVIVAGLVLSLPLVVVFGSLPSGLISALIIGFGMHQAWRMTGAEPLVVSGPFGVGAAEDPSSTGASVHSS